jgi:hypothetical protein
VVELRTRMVESHSSVASVSRRTGIMTATPITGTQILFKY